MSNSNPKSKSRTRHSKNRRSMAIGSGKPDYNNLESRLLLAVAVQQSGNELTIVGDATANVVIVRRAGANTLQVVADEVTRSFAFDSVSQINFFGGNGNDEFTNFTSIDTNASGQNGADVLTTNEGDDLLIGGAGADRIFAGDGDDTIRGGAGDDVLLGGRGNDAIIGGNRNDVLRGGAGEDILRGGAGDDSVRGGADNDVLRGGNGSDFLSGGDGIDSLFGDVGNDTLRGGDGDDSLFGGDQNDRIAGDNGNDTLNGGGAFDRVFGDAGDDLIISTSADFIRGGAGNDQLDLSNQAGGQISLVGDSANYQVTNDGGTLVVRDTRTGSNSDGLDLITGGDILRFTDQTRAAAADVIETVFVQAIVASNSNGSNTAGFFGNAEQEFDIRRRIDEIYLQVNVDIEWLDTRTVNNTFINQGNGSVSRPRNDLDDIVDLGDSLGVGNANRLVVDAYFVDVVPGFTRLGERFANGLAFVGANGTVISIGDSLVNSANGRATAASVTAHEIGHNLGLPHVEDPGNLLSEGVSSDELNSSQRTTILNSRLSQRI